MHSFPMKQLFYLEPDNIAHKNTVQQNHEYISGETLHYCNALPLLFVAYWWSLWLHFINQIHWLKGVTINIFCRQAIPQYLQRNLKQIFPVA